MRIAKSFTAAGVRSITAPPTTVTGPAAGRTGPATSSATASAVKAARTPAAAPRTVRGKVLRKLLMHRIRQHPPGGLAGHPKE
ncbi:hypothetical protein [Streptomyces virginiae]|uniref:hypothetical protein n=1 Tax=Streptomyces virginiae TaxID=1961 RepID=UPI0036F6ADB7